MRGVRSSVRAGRPLACRSAVGTLSAVLLLAGTSCAQGPKTQIAPAPNFSAQDFFSGRTEGSGVLKTLFSSAHSVHVHGTGHIAPDGALVLDQIVDETGKIPKTREWRIQQVTVGRYEGTLSDATGPVVGDVAGNRLHLRFRMKGGLDAEQWMLLSPGADTVQNHMTVRKFGIVVATLDEIIRKVG